MFFYIYSVFWCLLVISTTTTTTTVATRAPCGGNCACVVTPCPTIVVLNPCSPNPWLVFLFFCIEFEILFFVYSQNSGGCAVQNNAATRCWCPDNYQGYYCQYSMLKYRRKCYFFYLK